MELDAAGTCTDNVGSGAPNHLISWIAFSPEYYHLDRTKFVIRPRDYPNSENTAAVDTTAAFRGNAVIKILGVEQNAKYTITLWGETDIPKLISSTAKAGTTVKQIRDELVSQINQSYIAHAIGLEEDSEFMISPISSSEIALIRVTGKRNEVIIVLNETRFNLEDLSKGVPGYNVEFATLISKYTLNHHLIGWRRFFPLQRFTRNWLEARG